MDKPEEALEHLRQNIREYYDFLQGGHGALDSCHGEEVIQVLPFLFRSTVSEAETYFIVGKNRKVLSIDYGNYTRFQAPAARDLSQHRAFLHSIPELEKRIGKKGIDAAIITHYHDDHVMGLPLLKRLFGIEIIAGENLVDILRNPTKYDRQCLWREEIEATPWPLGIWREWNGIRLRLDPISGHTDLSTLVTVEADGVRVSHLGDEIFFRSTEPGFDYTEGSFFFSNHVYQNGLSEGDYIRFFHLMEELRPDWILSGHSAPYKPDGAWYEKVKQGAKRFDELHHKLMPLGKDDLHFGFSSQAAYVHPYRMHLERAAEVLFEAWITNPYPKEVKAEVSFACPAGWESESREISLGPREKKAARVKVTPPERLQCRRIALGLKVLIDGRSFGEQAEALVTIGHKFF